ncbi:hypothetical protein CRUP_015927, partial [Coryphaenoides rupestris]
MEGLQRSTEHRFCGVETETISLIEYECGRSCGHRAVRCGHRAELQAQHRPHSESREESDSSTPPSRSSSVSAASRSVAGAVATQAAAGESSGIIVLRPESAAAVKGKDITFVAKVDSTTLARKPSMKWLKGKWMDLGSKAGKHLTFKETYDRNTKIYTYEMSIIKVVDADAGGYRCEVTVKDKTDCCAFNITVE